MAHSRLYCSTQHAEKAHSRLSRPGRGGEGGGGGGGGGGRGGRHGRARPRYSQPCALHERGGL